MRLNTQTTALALLISTGLSAVLPGAAEAGSKGRRNTAIGLGAVAVYGIVKKQPLVAGLAGGGALYSYVSSRKAARRERNRRRYSRYRRSRYGYGSRYRYASHRHYRGCGCSGYGGGSYGGSRGKKKGWVHGMPPGQAKKYYR
jgi:hypothetical protein